MSEGKVIQLRGRAKAKGQAQSDSYTFPELILDEETGLFDILFEGVVTHGEIDVVGERERIRKAALVQSTEDPK